MTGPPRLLRLDGAHAGEQVALTRSLSVLGHHPAADCRFAPAAGSPVGPRHAAIIRSGERWMVRDLESGAGTWVNGERITHDHPLHPGDQIRLGEKGPAVEFGPPATGGPVSASSWRRRRGLVVAAVLVALAGLWATAVQYRGGRAAARQRTALVARIDSLATALARAETHATALAGKIQQAEAEARAARVALLAGGGRAKSRLDSLATVVGALVERQEPLVGAANLDLAALINANADAVALVLAERAVGEVVSGTGFAIRRSGDTSWVVTSRHVVQDLAGRGAGRLGVMFNGTAQNFRATLERVHPDADLALLRVVVRGGTPVVRGIEDVGAVGTAVGTITFPDPLDLSAEADWRRTGLKAGGFAGTILGRDAAGLELEGYGAEGMSGSPVFSSTGLVIGAIYGGAAGTGGRVVLAVPSARIRELLGAG